MVKPTGSRPVGKQTKSEGAVNEGRQKHWTITMSRNKSINRNKAKVSAKVRNLLP